MPRMEIEFDDKGELVGEPPAELTALFKRTETASYGQGYGKGVAKAAEDAKKQIEDNVKAELAKREALAPLEREKYQRIEEENGALKVQLTDKLRESANTLRSREEAHAQELVRRAEDLKIRNEKIAQLVKGQIRGFALEAGAREESLTELELILGASIGFDDNMEPYVKGADGQPVLVHGKPQTLGGFVKEYVGSHPHHRKPPAGSGGGARGGASFHGHTGQVPSFEAARDRIDGGDRSAGAINQLFESTRKAREAQR